MQSKEIASYEECIKLIKEMLNILKRETLFGNSHKNILDQYLYLSGLLGYYNSINDDFDGVIKISKKIDKYLSNVQDIMNNKENQNEEKNVIQYDNLYNQYSYYNSMLKSSVNFNNSSALKESQANIKKLQNKNKQSEMDLLNICILEHDDLKMSTHFKSMQELFKKWIGQKIELNTDKIILMYSSLYNQISYITKNILEDINQNSRRKNIEEVRNFVKQIIEMTGRQVVDRKNEFLKKLFQLPFFKNLFNKLYFVRIYSYFLEGRYQECLNDFSQHKLAKIQYELETTKSSEYMKKIEADCYFKLKKYKKAEEIYDEIIAVGAKDPLIHFNLGITAFFNDNKEKAISELEKANEIFVKEKNDKKYKTTEDIIRKFKDAK